MPEPEDLEQAVTERRELWVLLQELDARPPQGLGGRIASLAKSLVQRSRTIHKQTLAAAKKPH